jgi:hypothetical protein
MLPDSRAMSLNDQFIVREQVCIAGVYPSGQWIAEERRG